MSTPVRRSLAAEARAVEEGHHALVQPDGAVKVVSDTRPGKWYRVTFAARPGGMIMFTCEPDGVACYEDDHLRLSSSQPGLLPCKHAGVAARRLEREGLAECIGGRWSDVRPPHVHEYHNGRCICGDPEDPFEGLPH